MKYETKEKRIIRGADMKYKKGDVVALQIDDLTIRGVISSANAKKVNIKNAEGHIIGFTKNQFDRSLQILERKENIVRRWRRI